MTWPGEMPLKNMCFSFSHPLLAMIRFFAISTFDTGSQSLNSIHYASSVQPFLLMYNPMVEITYVANFHFRTSAFISGIEIFFCFD